MSVMCVFHLADYFRNVFLIIPLLFCLRLDLLYSSVFLPPNIFSNKNLFFYVATKDKQFIKNILSAAVGYSFRGLSTGVATSYVIGSALISFQYTMGISIDKVPKYVGVQVCTFSTAKRRICTQPSTYFVFFKGICSM